MTTPEKTTNDIEVKVPSNDVSAYQCSDTIFPINDLIARARERAKKIKTMQSMFCDIPL